MPIVEDNNRERPLVLHGVALSQSDIGETVVRK